VGLGFCTRAKLRKTRAFGVLSSVVNADDIVASFATCVRGTPLEAVYEAVRLSEPKVAFELRIHPAEELVWLEFEGEYVDVTARTSGAGPGYHEFLVSFLDRIGRDLGIAWRWDDAEEGEYVDETDFQSTRDFTALQASMSAQFQAICRIIADRRETQGNSGFKFSMPSDYWPYGRDLEVMTPTGPLSMARTCEIATLDGDDLTRAAKEHYPWLERGFGGNFYRGIALKSLWMNMRWAAPVNEAEVRDIAQALRWCEKSEPPLPANAIEQLRALADGTQAPLFPDESGIGYRRRRFRERLYTGWDFSVPGSLVKGYDEEDGTAVYWNDAITVRGSTISGTREGKPVDPQVRPVVTEKPGKEFGPSDDGEGFETVRVMAANFGTQRTEICILTVWAKDESLRPLAEKITSSISFRGAVKA